jgi:transcriptional regulator with GAF, ATPase, and Fis domain
MPVSGMFLYLFDDDSGALEVVASATAEGVERIRQAIRLPPDLVAQLRELEVEKNWEDIKSINDPESEPALRRLFPMIWDRAVSAINLDLEIDGETVGGLAIYAAGKNRYDARHARLIRILKGPFAIAMANSLRHQEVVRLKDLLADDNRYLRRELRSLSAERIVGETGGLRHVMEMVGQVAGLDSPVLLLGETGVGKEVIANAIHYTSPRQEGPFVKVNCGAIPEQLIDSELFGHEKGAFTGAVGRRRGRFERAQGGTIFLDEIAELPPQAQVRLLRVLQSREIERVGGTRAISVDIRVISATHRNLEEMVRQGRFREDLYFRLNIFPIIIPPLRQRRGDIPDLLAYFVRRKARELNLGEPPPMAPETLARLQGYAWPGNVRELENLVERELIRRRGRGGPLRFSGLAATAAPPSGRESDAPPADLPSWDEMNRRYIRRVLRHTGGKIHGPGGAAEIMAVNPNTLRSRMRKWRIAFGRPADDEARRSANRSTHGG